MPTPRRSDILSGILEQAGMLPEVHLRVPEAPEDRRHRHRMEEARAAHERTKDRWAFGAFVGVLVVVILTGPILLFVPGIAGDLKTAVWSTLSAIAAGLAVHLKSKGDKTE